MIISHKYAFIFIKTSKTAGTALEVDLNPLLGPDDVATMIYPAEAGHRAQNDIVNGIELYNHCPATLVRKAIGNDIFNSYTKFCIEREPVDKCISYFSMYQNSAYHNKDTRMRSWNEFIEARNFPTCDDKYLDADGALLVDHILKYERIDEDLRSLFGTLGVPFCGIRSRAKSGFRDKAFTTASVSQRDREIIYGAFARSLRYTGYRIDASAELGPSD